MDNKNLLDAISAALRTAGYTDISAQDGTDGAVVTAKKGAGAAYFRLANQAKTQVALRTQVGGPEPVTARLEVGVVHAVADLHDQLLKNPALAPAFKLPVEAVRQLK